MSISGTDLFKLVGRILIENAEAISAIDDTIDKAQGLSNTLSGVSEGVESTGRSMGKSGKFGAATVWMGNMFTRLTEKGIALGKFIGKTGFGFNANMEAYQNQFASLLGDADKAAQLVSDLQLLAKISPLGMEGLANNAVTLLTTGTELADIIPTLEMLGNLALGDANKMASVVRAYSQIMSKDALMAQEMWQLSDAGVPIIEIMTKYGGERYADGNWLMEKLSDKDYVIPAEHFLKAFRGAVAEGGKWHNYMYNMMDTWLGQTDRLGEEGKETLGAFMQPFFDMAKSNVLPGLTESLEKFGTWASENQDTLRVMAEGLGNFAKVSFDAVLSAFQWITENGNAVALAITGIATAMALAAGSAHPYAYAVTAIVSALAMMKSANADGDAYNGFFNKFSDEELQKLQAWVDAVNECREAEAAFAQNQEDMNLMNDWLSKQSKRDELFKEANAIEGLIAAYKAWNSGQAGNAGEDFYFDVLPKVSEDGEGIVQTALNSMELEATVKMDADTSHLQHQVNQAKLTAYVDTVVGGSGHENTRMHSHATGLVRVPYDGYLARLHKNEAVLTSGEAALWRSGMGNTGRMEAMLGQMMTIMQQVAANTAGGHQVVLDSGVLVGQIAPQMDARLGTFSARKGRGN